MISLRDVVTGFGNRDPLAEVWRRDLRGGGSAEITGTLPLYFSSRGNPLSDYLISGNTVQDGTPSPDMPVDVVGCGVWDETNRSYKLPLTVNGTEYPIYLGQVSTTRRIKKLVLTGGESWSRHTDTGTFVLAISGSDAAYLISGEVTCICTHYPAQNNTASYSQMADKKICMRANSSNAWIRDTDYSTSADFKSYLAAQYAAGTPVTVWYVLAEPVTGIVNEPLHKIGDYADTISFAQAGATIPTVSGANVLDMTSNVKPSEVYIKGKGIKPTGYGQLVDNNSVRILDKNNVRILAHGQ